MRILNDHIVSPSQESIALRVLDAPGPGGANHHYLAEWVERTEENRGLAPAQLQIHFQNGPIGEVGVNGVTNEVLAAILIDRLRGFQSGTFACRENAIALTHFQEGLMWLQFRTRDRLERGVEGTNEK